MQTALRGELVREEPCVGPERCSDRYASLLTVPTISWVHVWVIALEGGDR